MHIVSVVSQYISTSQWHNIETLRLLRCFEPSVLTTPSLPRSSDFPERCEPRDEASCGVSSFSTSSRGALRLNHWTLELEHRCEVERHGLKELRVDQDSDRPLTQSFQKSLSKEYML